MTLLVILGIVLGAAVVGLLVFLEMVGGRAAQQEIERECDDLRNGEKFDSRP